MRQAQGVGEVTVIASHTNPAAPAFVAADEAYVEPSGLMKDKYLRWCLTFCQDHAIEVFWVAKEARFLGLHQAEFAQMGVRLVLVAAPDTLALLGNKGEFYSSLPPEVALAMECISVKDKDSFNEAVRVLSAKHDSVCQTCRVNFRLGL